VRYSFHGKVRATGQQVDGFVEAANATQAIDRLADQGIIGVYSVRPEEKIPKNAVILAGQEVPEEEAPPQRRLERSSGSSSRQRPIPAVAVPRVPPSQVQEHLPPPQVTPQPAPAQAPADGNTAILTQLVEKVSALMLQVEKLMSRPSQVIYQSSGPARSGGGGGKKSSRIPNEAQNNTLRDIFLTNLDLRQSLEKLATTVGPSTPKNGAIANGEPVAVRETPKPPREPVASSRELIQAQPAA
jgi:hypothetical protein